MTVYVFNLLVGFSPNGIDNAQGYREKMFDQIGLDSKYVFTEFPDMRDIMLYKNVGIPVDKMINPHLKLTGRDCFNFTDNTESMIQRIQADMNVSEMVRLENSIQFWNNGYLMCEIYTLPFDQTHFYKVLYFKENCLLKKEFYSGGLVYSDYYITAKNENGSLYAKLVKRSFYKENGEVCFEQIGDDYLLNNGEKLNHYDMLDLFFDMLKLSKKDTFILDRAFDLRFNHVILEKRLPCKIICVIHSGHYFEPNQSPYALFLNFEYYFWFKYSKYIDSFVVSTESQKSDLINVLTKYKYDIPRINVIPVGSVDGLRVSNNRKRKSIITASRIVRGKRIDLLIRAVIEAHKIDDDISLDIYGEDDFSLQSELMQIIQNNNASDYIRFRGFQCLDEVYQNYELYITTSNFETFGLTLLEAVSSGCALIGLNVPYGNTTFIANGKNGYLIDYNYDCTKEYENELVKSIASRIIDVFANQKNLSDFMEYSYKIANEFLETKISEKWRKML
jgi:poly(glycerol-phosphate) alpha-glucosyltransferase